MAVILLVVLTSCASLGSNTFTSENRRAGLAEALSTETEADKKKDLALELPFADAVRTTPSAAAEPVPVQSAEKEEVPVTEEEVVVPEEKDLVTTSAETVKEEPAPAVEETVAVPEPAPVAEEKEAVQEKAIENIPKDGIMEKLEAIAGLSGVKLNAKLSVFSEGSVITEEGTVRKMDLNASMLIMDDGKRIPLKDILSLDLSAE